MNVEAVLVDEKVCEVRHKSLDHEIVGLKKKDETLEQCIIDLSKALNGKFTKIMLLGFSVLGGFCVQLLIMLLGK